MAKTQDTQKIIYSMVGVSKFHDKKPVLKDIYLSYYYGAKIGVIGLNGSGKSSLLRILAGLEFADPGSGRRQGAHDPEERVGGLRQRQRIFRRTPRGVNGEDKHRRGNSDADDQPQPGARLVCRLRTWRWRPQVRPHWNRVPRTRELNRRRDALIWAEIVAIVDHNKIQSDNWVSQVSDLGDIEAKFRAFG